MKVGKILKNDLRDYLESIKVDPDDQATKRDIAAYAFLANYTIPIICRIEIKMIPQQGEPIDGMSKCVIHKDLSMRTIIEFFDEAKKILSEKYNREVELDYDDFIDSTIDF